MNNHYSFIGGTEGPWRVTHCEAIIGAPLETVQKLNVVNSPSSSLTTRGADPHQEKPGVVGPVAA